MLTNQLLVFRYMYGKLMNRPTVVVCSGCHDLYCRMKINFTLPDDKIGQRKRDIYQEITFTLLLLNSRIAQGSVAA